MKLRWIFPGLLLLFLSACSQPAPKALSFVPIPAGTFEMGGNPNLTLPMPGKPPPFIAPYRQKYQPLVVYEEDELPRRFVTITKPFYLSACEVTQAQWESVMGTNPSFFKGPDLPVESVSWNDVQAFIARLNQKEPGAGYRLPTEAEWEYASRAGGATLYPFGDTMEGIDEYAWYYGNSNGHSHPVGQKKPNPWGLYDMTGNVWEWTGDWYDQDWYSQGENKDPQGPITGWFKVYRGSSWYFYSECCRSADRENSSPDYKAYYLGFRLAKSAG